MRPLSYKEGDKVRVSYAMQPYGFPSILRLDGKQGIVINHTKNGWGNVIVEIEGKRYSLLPRVLFRVGKENET